MTGEGKFKIRRSRTARSHLGMVSSASKLATEAGARMLEEGGNAVDAAVAAAFCLGVTEPQASGLGGQSSAVLHLGESQKNIAIDGSSRAPFGIDPTRLPDKPKTIGLQSATLPSTPATLGYMLERYGKLSLSAVLQPSIEAALDGYPVSALQHRLIRREREHLLEDKLAARLLFKNGAPLAKGDHLVQPELATCFQRLAAQGWKDFYLGEIGNTIVADMQKRTGLLTKVDLSQIPIPQERPVLEGRYRGHRLATFPPPGAGRALVEILNILETFDPEELDLAEPFTYLILAHVFMNALRDRNRRAVDPDLYLQTRTRRMTDKHHAERISERIRKLIPERKLGPSAPEGVSGETTHLCAADSDGNVVAITQSIELVFGSKRVNPDYGFFYNNYMNTFEYKDMTHPYYLLPGAKPWSSVAPTILFSRRQPWLTLGSPGSERISTSLAQVIMRVVDAGMGLDEAISAPRLHAGKAGKVQIEKKRFEPRVSDTLQAAGFEITKRGAYSFYLGCVQAIQLPRNRKEDFLGVADPRRDGDARGPAQ